MNRLLNLVSVLIFSVLIFSCGQSNEKGSCSMEEEIQTVAKDIICKEFYSKISKNTIVLDVRTPEEYENGHIENSVNINFFDADFLDKANELNSDKTILVYCAAGGRSSKAMKKLSENGFYKVYNLIGGFTAWENEGLPIVK